MTTFAYHFFICNIFIGVFIALILVLKHLFRNHLSPRLHYNLWFIMLILLMIPFIPFQEQGLFSLFSGLLSQNFSSVLPTTDHQPINTPQSFSTNLLNDFSISVNKFSSSTLFFILGILWIVGMLAMILLALKSRLHLYRIEQSSLLIHNQKINTLFKQCKAEINMKGTIPIYCTVSLKSPIMIGIFKPRIYIPTQLLSDFHEKELRYIFLHELQHCRHLDSLMNCFMNFYKIIYWFNPLVWHFIKEIENDRETACDVSVLQKLNKDEYIDYGNTLINFAEKISLSSFPFASGIGGNIKQLKKRILNIASYQPQSFSKKIQGRLIYCFIGALIFVLTPIMSAFASTSEYYHFHPAEESVSYVDLSSYFKDYHGSFVLYDTKANTWHIYNKNYAAMRVSPNSTYKIYDALIGLESGIITPDHSELKWDGSQYSFDAWNMDQNLNTAIQNSVNWYFQTIDKQAGFSTVKKYINEIGYGNKNINGDFSSYWMESSLKISPIEQVELLRKFYYNNFNFDPENITAVKNALRISSSNDGAIYGKTGTGQVNYQNINGWFVGYVENSSNIYFFATNIQNKTNATGKSASDITFSILSDMKIWD